MNSIKVLLVDDEEEFTITLAERLINRDMAVETASDGLTALKKVRENNYDAVILDLAMPELDGIDTLKLMLDKNPNLQIIILTGYASVEKGVEAIKLGAKDFIEKPVDINALMAKINEAKAEKMLIVEKGIEKKIKDILKYKGW